MKLTFFILMICLMKVSATVYSQATKFSFNVQGKQVFDVLKEIEDQSDFRFVYQREQVDVTKKVDLKVTDETVETILEKLFVGQDISCKVLQDNLIVIAPRSITYPGAVQQSRTISGKVTDASGTLLPGVSVVVKGTTQGTVTDPDGNYTLVNVPGNATLVFSFIGYTTREVAVNNQANLNVTLDENIQEIEEVKILGYTQAKRDITGAIVSIGSEDIARKQAINVYDAMRGAASGVQVLSNSGAPGERAGIRIRGISTLSDAGTEPLYIVDGVQADGIDNINPNDITSVEILKDAASAAIYGSRSANGVVIVSTKQGNEGKPQLSLQYLNSYSSLSHKIPQGNRFERLSIFDRADQIGLDPLPNDSTAFATNADNDYQEVMTQLAARHQIDFGISGGTPQMKYRASAQYLDETGIMIFSGFKRFSGRINTIYTPNKKLSVKSNAHFYQTHRDIVNENLVMLAMMRQPYFALYWPDGTLAPDVAGQKNPILLAKERFDEASTYEGGVSQSIDYKIFDWLSLHGDISGRVYIWNSEYFSPKILGRVVTSTAYTEGITSGRTQSSLVVNGQGNLWLAFDKKIEKHKLSATVGATAERNKVKNMSVGGRNYATESIRSLNAAGELLKDQTYSNFTGNALAGFFGRVGYDYAGRYLVNATFRADGSSRFGSANRWGYFPSASAGWRFSDESFMRWARSVLTDGKLRLSVGKTGQQSIGNFDALLSYNVGSAYNGSISVLPDSRMGNNTLQWESTTQYDVAVDLNLLDSRVNFTAEYYVKNTDHLLALMPMPRETGYSDVRTNFGSIQNKGVELMLRYNVIRTRDWEWNTSVSWSKNKNTITELPGEDYISNQRWWVGKDYEAGVFYGYKHLGIYQYDASNAWNEDFTALLTPVFEKDEYGNVALNKRREPVVLGYSNPDGTPYTGPVKQQEVAGGTIGMGGDVIWQELPDKNGVINGIVDAEDQRILGSGHPQWFAGWDNFVRYRNFSLSFSFYGSFGNKVFNHFIYDKTTYVTTNWGPSPYTQRNFWKYPGQITDAYKRGNFNYNARYNSSYFLEDASYIRLQNARLNYILPAKKMFFIDKLELYVYGNNLLTWTNYSGFDPEVAQGSVLNPGNDTGRYPRKREIGFGINLNF
ncbi:MAG: TonB-dependent receptor [Mangrovibacterium sp.]